MKATWFLCLVLLVVVPVSSVAHPDHDEDEKKVVVGTVTGVQPQTIELEVMDFAAARLTTLVILIDEETTFQEERSPVEPLTLVRRDRVEATVMVSHAPDGSDQFRAVKIRRL